MRDDLYIIHIYRSTAHQVYFFSFLHIALEFGNTNIYVGTTDTIMS